MIAAANLLARQHGVYPGMSVSEATALGRDASLVILDHDPQEDIESLCWLADAAQQFSPIVGLESLEKKLWAGRSLHQPQGIVCDATNLGPIFGGEQAMAEAVRHWLAQQGYVSCVAIADSLGAAWALANFGRRQQIAESLLQQQQAPRQQEEQPIPSVPTALSAPAPLSAPASQHTMAPVPPIVIEPHSRPIELLSLPVEALRIEPEVAKSLRRLGIQSIESLLQLPRPGLASRFGTALIERIDQAWEGTSEPIVALHAEADLQVSNALEYPTNQRATIDELVRRQTSDLCRLLSNRGRGALRMLCRIDLVQAPSLVLQLGLFRASSDPEHLTPLLLGQLEQQWSHKPTTTQEVYRLTIQATSTGPLLWQQPELFEVEQVLHRNSIAKLIDGLSSRLGRRAVVSPQIHRDPQPELACSWRPLTGYRQDGQRQETARKLPRRNESAEPSIDDPLRRPIAILPKPLAIQVQVDEHSEQPTKVHWNGRVYQVARSWGAERIESGWWRGPSHRRDYFRIELDSGDWLWIFRQLNSSDWYLHGEFT